MAIVVLNVDDEDRGSRNATSLAEPRKQCSSTRADSMRSSSRAQTITLIRGNGWRAFEG